MTLGDVVHGYADDAAYEIEFVAGAGTHPGAGMPGVLSTARVLDSIVPAPSELRPVYPKKTSAVA